MREELDGESALRTLDRQLSVTRRTVGTREKFLELTQAQLIEALDRLCRDAVPGVAERTAKIDARRFAEFEKLRPPLREAFA